MNKRCAELARDAPLVARWVPAERVLAAESRAKVPVLVRVVDGNLGFETDFQSEGQPTNNFRQEKNLGCPVKHGFQGSLQTEHAGRKKNVRWCCALRFMLC